MSTNGNQQLGELVFGGAYKLDLIKLRQPIKSAKRLQSLFKDHSRPIPFNTQSAAAWALLAAAKNDDGLSPRALSQPSI